jgi:hypothetical protein
VFMKPAFLLCSRLRHGPILEQRQLRVVLAGVRETDADAY